MNQAKPKVSLFASAIRRDVWEMFYEKISSSNRVPLEIVFVGPSAPLFTLPKNFKFIESKFKPAQCSAIAAENCSGDFLLQVVDDIEYSPGAVDLMYSEISKFPESMVTCHYFMDDQDLTLTQNATGERDPRLPLMPVCGMFSKNLYKKAQGFDRRFRGVFWELDFYMRLTTEHRIPTRFVDGICRERTIDNPSGDRLSHKNWGPDRGLFDQLWRNLPKGSDAKAPLLIRKDSVMTYDVNSLLTVEQS